MQSTAIQLGLGGPSQLSTALRGAARGGGRAAYPSLGHGQVLPSLYTYSADRLVYRRLEAGGPFIRYTTKLCY